MTTSEVAPPPVPADRRGLAVGCREQTSTTWRRRCAARRPVSRRPTLRRLRHRTLSRRPAPIGTPGTVSG